MKIRKVTESKKEEKVKDQEIGFDAKSLTPDEEKVGFKTSVDDDQEKIDNEFKKELGKIEKFESFTERTEDEEFDPEYEWDNGCNCCDKCTNDETCNCGCDNCQCNCSCNSVSKASDIIKSDSISENLKYHLDKGKSIVENVFRPGSNSFIQLLKEARNFFDKGQIELTADDKELFESTDIGRFAYFNGELVPLDLPMENIQELNEAEYKGKEVKLNYPMRGGSKKYYVYVKNPKTGKVKKISFGDTTGLSAKVSDPEARKSFAARHKCSTKKDKTKAGYWACRINRYGHLWGGKTYPGYW